LNSVSAIMGGEHANYALRSDGTVWAWGSGGNGELGNNTYADSSIPVPVIFAELALFLPLTLR
jgi:alpha-tubulin suppressor-like RCC1 family protein